MEKNGYSEIGMSQSDKARKPGRFPSVSVAITAGAFSLVVVVCLVVCHINQKTYRGDVDLDEDAETEEGSKAVEKEAEISFLRNWNIGDININLSVAGFNKVIDIKDLPLDIPSFQRHYKIGSTAYLVKKPVIHLVKSLLSSGIGKKDEIQKLTL